MADTMMTSSSSLNQPGDCMTIYNIILSAQIKGLQDDDYDQIESISKNCDVNARLIDCHSETLMHLSIREKNEKLMEMFYKYGGDFFIRNKSNQTPRDLAVKFSLTKILKFIDDNEIIALESEEIFVKIKRDEDKRNVKAIQLNANKFDKIFEDYDDVCFNFPNLFALKILNKTENEKILIDKIADKFNDGRPLFVCFQSNLYCKRENSDEFKVADSKLKEEIEAIINHSNIPISLIEKYCKSNDSLMIRILKLRKCSNNLKLTESVLKLSDNVDLFKAVIYEPFSRQVYDFLKFEDMITRDDNENIVKLLIKHDKVKFVDCLIKIYKYYLQYSPFTVKKLLVDFVANNKMFDYENTLYELIQSDFPFPVNVETLNDERIKTVLKDREIFKSNDLESIKKYVNENKSMRIGYNRENESALLYAIENKKFNVYSLLLSIGFRTDDAHEIKELIDELSDKEKAKIGAENANNAHSDDKNHLRLLTNKFAIFGHYDRKEIYENFFIEIITILEELDSIEKIKPLLRFCAEVEMLKVTLDFESEDISKMYPSKQGYGITCPNSLIFAAGQHDHDKVKRIIVHELCHLAMRQFYENNAKPYYFNDSNASDKFEKITEKILDLVESEQQIDNECKEIILGISDYDSKKHQNEMIVRAFEIIVYFNGDESKIQELPNEFDELFDYVDEYVVKALKSEEIKTRAKVRDLNAYIDLLQNIKRYNNRLEISENSLNNTIFDEIFNNSQKNYIIVTNVPMLALINIKSYLLVTQKSLYDAKNIFIDPKQLRIQKKFDEFQKIEKSLSSVIIDASSDCGNISFTKKKRLIFVTTSSKYKEVEERCYFSLEKIVLNYNWNNLSKESQNKLVEKVNFQGQDFKLSEIIDENLINEEIIDSMLFVDLCNEKNIFNINTKVNQLVFYIERKFCKIILSSKNRIEEAFADSHVNFLTKTEQNKKILISDIAGSGKSFILKKISSELISKCNSNKNYWVLFIDLRKYLQEFRRWKDQKCFLSLFHAHFGRNLKNYEKKIFEILYFRGKVKIFLDGFDEISPICKDIVIDFVKSIQIDGKIPSSSTSELQEYKNQLWITTRKHLENELKEKLEISAIFSLKSLETDEEMIEFLVNYWRSKNVNLVDNLDDLAKEVISKFEELEFNYNTIIGQMQQLKILAEICIQNDEIKVESLGDFTMYEIYERSVLHFIDDWRKRPDCKEFVKKVDMSSLPNFVVNHQYHALLASYKKEFVWKITAHFGKMWNLEQIEKCGLVTFENNQVYFIHTTYLEFFIANFFVQSLGNSLLCSDFLIEIFCTVMFNSSLTPIQMFINDKIKSLDLTEDVIEKFVQHLTKLNNFNILYFSIIQKQENIFNFLLNIIERIDGEKRNQFLINDSNTYYGNYLYDSLKSSNANVNIFNELLRVTTECLTEDEFIKLLYTKVYDHIIFHLFKQAHVSCEVMKALMCAIGKKLGSEHTQFHIKQFLLIKDDDFKKIPLQMILKSTNANNFNKFEFFWDFHFKYMTLEELIEQTSDHRELNILHNIAYNSNILVHRKLWEQSKIDFQSNKSKLHKLLLEKNKFGLNFLHIIVWVHKSSVEILKFNLTEITKFFSHPIEIFSSKVLDGITLLQISLLQRNSLEVFKYLWNFLKSFFCRDDFIKQINELNLKNSNAFHIALTNKKEHIQFIMYSLEKDLNMSKTEMKSFLIPQIDSQNTKKGRNILAIAVEHISSFDIHFYLWNILEDYFNTNEIFDLINEVNSNGLNLLGIIVTSKHQKDLNVIQLTWNKIKHYLKIVDEQRKYLEQCVFLLNQSDHKQWLKEQFILYGMEFFRFR